MCIRPPCENCGADYDACCPACPKCGHPNGDPSAGTLLPALQFKVVKEKHYCKICKCDHEVTRYELE